MGDNARKGAVRKRMQLQTKMTGQKVWAKRSKENGRFMDQEANGTKFKGVRNEK